MIDQTCDATDDMREWGQQAVGTAVESAAADRGTFIGEAVTTSEYQDGAADVLAQFASAKKSSSAQDRDLARQARKLLKSKEIKDLVTPQPGECGSDLIGAIASLSDSIDNEPQGGARSKDIVFVTNGIVIDDERGWNFVRDDMTPEYTDDVIAAMKKEGTFPDLSGASVTLVGLGEREPPLTAQKKSEIQAFWKEFADASGALQVRDIGNVGQLELPLEQ